MSLGLRTKQLNAQSVLGDENSHDQLASSLASYFGYPPFAKSFPPPSPDSDPLQIVSHTLNRITSTASADRNWTTSISPDLLSKRPNLSSRAQDRTVSPSAGPCPHILARAEVYPFSKARRLPCDVAYQPMSAPQQPAPRPSVLGRTIVAAECVS